jgi:hypothetical protein
MLQVNQLGGPVMTIGNLTSKQQTKAMNQVSTANDVRAIIANYLGVDVERLVGDAVGVGDHPRRFVSNRTWSVGGAPRYT